MAHGGRGLRRLILCAHWEGEEVVLGNHLGRRRILLMDSVADRRELSFAPKLSQLLCLARPRPDVEGCALRRDVGRGQRELRTDNAPPGHVAGHWRGDRRYARGGHSGAADHAWT